MIQQLLFRKCPVFLYSCVASIAGTTQRIDLLRLLSDQCCPVDFLQVSCSHAVIAFFHSIALVLWFANHAGPIVFCPVPGLPIQSPYTYDSPYTYGLYIYWTQVPSADHHQSSPHFQSSFPAATLRSQLHYQTLYHRDHRRFRFEGVAYIYGAPCMCIYMHVQLPHATTIS